MKTEERIKKDVVNQLYWDNRVDANNIKVKVNKDKVTLTGTVLTYAAKINAANITKSVPQVCQIDNQLKVVLSSNYAIPTDKQIKKAIKDRLNWNSEIDPIDIKDKVNKGMVILSGTVPSYWQKISAEMEIEKVRGVIGVTNKLAVVPTKRVADELIAERIVNRIDQNTAATVDQVNVKVENGKVFLTGEVPTWSTWQAVYDAAQYTDGVIIVEDALSIKYS